jgi:hypothetical protein
MPKHPTSLLLGIAISLLPAFALQAQAKEAEKVAPKTEAAQNADAAKKPESPKWIRVVNDAKGRPLAMETIVASYVYADDAKDKKVVVDLVGAVHIGDASYYEQLNKLFESYDVVLYELVAPEGTRVPKGGAKAGGSPLSALQGGMKDLLGLEFQLECVDYTKKNFVHADMSPKQFSKSMKDRGESFVQLFFRMMGASMAQQATSNGKAAETEMLMAFFAKDRTLRMKRALSKQFENMEGSMAAFGGPNGSTLLTERNKHALKILRKQLDDGKQKVAIFYGAGHLSGMDKQLLDEFKMKRAGQKWIPAWDLRSK